jgi:hypothetical protein
MACSLRDSLQGSRVAFSVPSVPTNRLPNSLIRGRPFRPPGGSTAYLQLFKSITAYSSLQALCFNRCSGHLQLTECKSSYPHLQALYFNRCIGHLRLTESKSSCSHLQVLCFNRCSGPLQLSESKASCSQLQALCSNRCSGHLRLPENSNEVPPWQGLSLCKEGHICGNPRILLPCDHP